MIKRVALLARRPDFDRAAFSRYWRATHATIVCCAAGIRRYLQNHVTEELGKPGRLSIDGIVELWFDDEAAMRGWAAGATEAGYLLDEPKFMRGVTLFLTDDGAPPRPSPDAVKLMAVRRDPVAVSADLPGLLAHGIDRVLTKAHRDSLPLGLQDADVIETCWLDRRDRLASPIWAGWLEGGSVYVIDEVAIVGA